MRNKLKLDEIFKICANINTWFIEAGSELTRVMNYKSHYTLRVVVSQFHMIRCKFVE